MLHDKIFETYMSIISEAEDAPEDEAKAEAEKTEAENAEAEKAEAEKADGAEPSAAEDGNFSFTLTDEMKELSRRA